MYAIHYSPITILPFIYRIDHYTCIKNHVQYALCHQGIWVRIEEEEKDQFKTNKITKMPSRHLVQ